MEVGSPLLEGSVLSGSISGHIFLMLLNFGGSFLSEVYGNLPADSTCYCRKKMTRNLWLNIVNFFYLLGGNFEKALWQYNNVQITVSITMTLNYDSFG